MDLPFDFGKRFPGRRRRSGQTSEGAGFDNTYGDGTIRLEVAPIGVGRRDCAVRWLGGAVA